MAPTATSRISTDLPTFEGDKGLQAVKEVVVAINANNRQGTHSTKTRGEVRGGGKKPWRQKGTGRARAGSIRSPLWVGGGVVFGPKPRDYSKKINAKVKALAFSRALFDRASAGEIAVIEAFEPTNREDQGDEPTRHSHRPEGQGSAGRRPFRRRGPPAPPATSNAFASRKQRKLNTHDLCSYRMIIVSSKALEAIIARVNGGKN